MALLPAEQLHAVAEAYGDETAYSVVGGGSMTFRGVGRRGDRVWHADW